jgi:hypothetical protein
LTHDQGAVVDAEFGGDLLDLLDDALLSSRECHGLDTIPSNASSNERGKTAPDGGAQGWSIGD